MLLVSGFSFEQGTHVNAGIKSRTGETVVILNCVYKLKTHLNRQIYIMFFIFVNSTQSRIKYICTCTWYLFLSMLLIELLIKSNSLSDNFFFYILKSFIIKMICPQSYYCIIYAFLEIFKLQCISFNALLSSVQSIK